MSQNIEQIYIANPTTAMVSNDLLYLGRSPYGASDDFAITWNNLQLSITAVGIIAAGTWQGTTVGISYGGTGVTSVTTAPTAGAFAGWDTNRNLSADNFLNGYTTTVTAAGSTTLTVNSTYFQYFTGVTTQTMVLPVTSTLALGQSFFVVNNSSGDVTINSSGGNLVQTMAGGTALLVTCILTSGTTAASWDANYIIQGGGVQSITGTANQVIASSATGNVVLSLPQSIGTASTPSFGGLSLTAALTVPNGGTGIQLAPAYALLAGGTTDTSALQSLAVGTAGQFLQSGGGAALPSWSTATFPGVGGAAGNILISNGTNYVASTSLWPNTVGAAGVILRSNGTTNAYSTSTFADTYAVSTILYASSANTVAGLATGNNGVLITSAGGVPSISSTLPSGIAATNMALTTPNIGVATGTSLIVSGVIQSTGSSLLSGSATGGFAGFIAAYSTTASRGYFALAAANNAANYGVTLTNASFGQDTVITFPDPGASTATVAYAGSSVASITGTANQVLANATSATPQTGAVTLTLPQNIALTSTPTFAGMTLSAASTPSLNISATSATGIPYIQMFRNTNTSIGVIQPGSTSDGSATGSGLWINNGIAGGSIYMNITGTGNALTISPTASTFLGASDTSLNIVSSSATGMPYIQWTNNTSTAINYIQAGTNVTGNASSTGTLFVNNIAGGDFFFNVTGTGNLLTLGVSAATFSKSIGTLAGAVTVGSTAGQADSSVYLFSPTANLGTVIVRAANNGGAYNNILTNASTSTPRTWTLPDASGTIALTSGSGAMTYTSVSGTSQAAVGGNAYILNNAGATTVTLPTSGSSTIGDTIKIKGRSAAAWIIQANTSQVITYGSTSSSTAGTATSAAGTDSLQLVYVAANEWSVDWALSSGIILA